ncbi:MAG: hypothetical protein HOB38_20420 [Deltaproteobacteria bacterium]|jgi:hypothetical protein|nr:hypothetical protein [Deltaproteobacteria bacterium]
MPKKIMEDIDMNDDYNDFKKICRLHIYRHKVALKVLIRHLSRVSGECRIHRRAIRKLEARTLPFDHVWIKAHSTKEHRLKKLVDQAEANIVRFAGYLKPWLDVYDDVASFADKAAVLGTSITALWNKLNEYEPTDPKTVGLYELIMVHHGEWSWRRGEVDCVPADKTRMPLFYSFLLHDRHLMKTDPGFHESVSKAIDEFFPRIPNYQEYRYPDGSTKMVRLPPDLKIVQKSNDHLKYIN